MPTPHIHKEAILAFAEGAEIQVMESGQWIDCMPYPTFDSDHAYRVKPAAPKWPQTTMTDKEMSNAIEYTLGVSMGRSTLANAVIAHECGTGALVPADKVREISAGAYAQGAKSARDPVDIIEAVFDHLRAGIADPESIQAILLRAAK